MSKKSWREEKILGNRMYFSKVLQSTSVYFEGHSLNSTSRTTVNSGDQTFCWMFFGVMGQSNTKNCYLEIRDIEFKKKQNA